MAAVTIRSRHFQCLYWNHAEGFENDLNEIPPCKTALNVDLESSNDSQFVVLSQPVSRASFLLPLLYNTYTLHIINIHWHRFWIPALCPRKR